MLAQLIQRQIPIGSQVTFLLKDGHEISGTLTEIGRDHITVESDRGSSTVMIEMIGAWQVLEESPKTGEKATEGQKSDGAAIPGNQSARPIQVEPPLDSIVPEPEVLKKLIEIEAWFHAQLQTAKIEPRPPDFTLPVDEFKGKQKAEALIIWNRLKDRYEYALKINEVSAKFGRIQPIVNDLKSLTNWFPISTSVKKHLAYFYWISGNKEEALACYQDAALISEDAVDWYNVAALALKEGKGELACYSLEQFFRRVSVPAALDAWYLYVRLLNEFTNYPALASLDEIKEHAVYEEEWRILLETGIYLLKVNDNEKIARDLVQKCVSGQPLKSLTREAFTQLNGKPSDTYQQKISELIKVIEGKKKTPLREIEHQPQGYIYSYTSSRGIGFIRGIDGEKYFFHRSAIVDDALFHKIRNLGLGKQIPVVFETVQGPKGPLAIGISLYRTIDEMFQLANEYANDGAYPRAIAQIRKVLLLNPAYPGAEELNRKWREYVRISDIPKGSFIACFLTWTNKGLCNFRRF